MNGNVTGANKSSSSTASGGRGLSPTSTTPSCSSSSVHMHTTVQLPPIDMSLEEQRALGYMPLRDDFEREFKNYAESMLSTLSLTNNQLAFMTNRDSVTHHNNSHYSNHTNSNHHHHHHHHHISNSSSHCTSSNSNEPNEDHVDYELKLTLIKMYRETLIERQKMKKIAREYGLINNASALINNYNYINNGILSPVYCLPNVRDNGSKKRRGYHSHAANRKDPR